MNKHFPGRTMDNTGTMQLRSLLDNLPKALEMEASYQAAALAQVMVKILGGGK